MYRKIIVGYDGSDQAEDALALGRMLAGPTGASLLLVHVFRRDIPIVPGWEAHIEAVRTEAARVLDEAASQLEGVEVETHAVGSTSPARGLQDFAGTENADLIVVGSSHRGRVGRVLMGTVSDRLFAGAPCAVAIAPRRLSDQSDDDVRVIGVAFDGSPESWAALEVAARLGEAMNATLRVFAVAQSSLHFGYPPTPTTYDHEEAFRSMKEHLEHALAGALESLPRALRASGQVLSGDAAELLASKAGEGMDLLVAGSRGYGPARRVLLGSVSSKLARSAPCPLLVIPRTAERSGEKPSAAVTASSAV
jgi:nucleotide-binding universal stress UspA family protein